MKFTELEIAGMLQDNQDTIYELKAKIKRLEKFIEELHEQNPSMEYFPPDVTLEDIEDSIQASKEEGEQ